MKNEKNVTDLKLNFNKPMLLELYSDDRLIMKKVAIAGDTIDICNTNENLIIVIKYVDITMKL